MPRPPFRVALFLSSYAPLFGLLAFTNRHERWAWIALACVALISVLGLLAVMAALDDEGPTLVVERARPQDGEALSYIATYLIPFLGADLSTASGIVTFAGFLVVLMTIYVRSSMLFVNPLLSLCGFHSYEIEDKDGHAYALLTRRADVARKDTLQPAQVSRYLRVEVSRVR